MGPIAASLLLDWLEQRNTWEIAQDECAIMLAKIIKYNHPDAIDFKNAWKAFRKSLTDESECLKSSLAPIAAQQVSCCGLTSLARTYLVLKLTFYQSGEGSKNK